jgi:hypothetical protein
MISAGFFENMGLNNVLKSYICTKTILKTLVLFLLHGQHVCFHDACIGIAEEARSTHFLEIVTGSHVFWCGGASSNKVGALLFSPSV